MIAAVLTVVQFLAVIHACVSQANDAPPQALSLFSIFQACKTGVLTVSESDVTSEWLRHYQLLPTKESVGRIGQLLLKDCASDVPHRHSGKNANAHHRLASILAKISGKATQRSPNVLVSAVRKHAEIDCYFTSRFLARYVIFKSLLHGGLSKGEAKAFKSIVSKVPLSKGFATDLGRLVAGLSSTQSNGGLFMALANCACAYFVRSIISDLNTEYPEIVARLFRGYIAGCNTLDDVSVPLGMFSCLSIESQYELLKNSKAFSESVSDVAGWRNLYILSRFSESPSKDVENWCLGKKPKYMIYGEVAQEAKDNLAIKMKRLSPRRIPREIWIKILLYCDNPLFQIYTVPLVCKFWKHLHRVLLTCSLTVQDAFAADLKNLYTMHLIFNYRRYPWNYFLRSPQALLGYSLRSLGRAQSKPIREIREWILASWLRIVHETKSGRLAISSESYVGLYVRCFKAIESPVNFYQLPGMSDDEYFAWTRIIIDKHKIVPNIPASWLRGDCGRFVQILEKNTDLVTSLLQDYPWCYDLVAIHLFLVRPHIPPMADKVLCQRSALYRPLMDETSDIDECLSAVLHLSVGGFDEAVLARSLVDFCLTSGLQCEPEGLRLLAKKAWKCYFDRYRKGAATYPKLIRPVREKLSLAIMTFLCEHCQDYTEEDFGAIERVLELCEIFDQDGKLYASRHYIYKLLSDPRVSIELLH